MDFVSRWAALAFVAITGALLGYGIVVNVNPMVLSVDVAVSRADEAQLFFSRTGAWNEAQSVKLAINPGIEQLTFEISANQLSDSVRLDPGKNSDEFHVLAVRWQRGLLSRDQPLETIRNLRPEHQRVRVEGGRLVVQAVDNDLQLEIPAPGLFWRIAGFLLPLGFAALAWLAFAALAAKRRIEAPAVARNFLVSLSIFYCLVSAANWTPLPIYDDWRYVLNPPFEMFGAGNAWLTLVVNDTYFLTGQLIDFAVLSLSNIDFGVLRVVSFALMFLQIWAMYRILVTHVAPVSRVGAAVAIMLVAATLTTNAYWGGTVIAYHQFLPLLFATLTLLVVGRAQSGGFGWPQGLAVTAFCIAAGLAYISGGLMLVATGVGILLAYADRAGRRQPAFRAGVLVAALGVALLVLQVWLVSKAQGSLLEHNHAVASVLPNDRRFWLYLVALFGRAAGYAGTNPIVDAALLAVAILPAVVIGCERLWHGLVRGRACERPFLAALVLGAAFMSLGYAAAVGFGRSGFTTPDQPAFIVVAVAKGRFHFWAIAALLPLLWLGWVELALRLRGRLGPRLAYAGFAAAALVLVTPKSQAPYELAGFFRDLTKRATQGAYCAIAQADGNPPGEPIICFGLIGLHIDLTGPLQRLKADDRRLYRQLERIAAPATAQRGAR